MTRGRGLATGDSGGSGGEGGYIARFGVERTETVRGLGEVVRRCFGLCCSLWFSVRGLIYCVLRMLLR